MIELELVSLPEPDQVEHKAKFVVQLAVQIRMTAVVSCKQTLAIGALLEALAS